MDKYTKEIRSKIMSSIRSSGNRTTEQELRMLLVRSGISDWKIHPSGLMGKPDFIFPKAKLAIFVDGCFWHGCPRCYQRPRSSRSYWDTKIQRNKSRDRRVAQSLRRGGWSVMRIWEHSLVEMPVSVMKRINAKVFGK